jgi:phage gp46-like protein
LWSEFLQTPNGGETYLRLMCHRKADGSTLYWADALMGQVTGSRLWALRGAPDSEETRQLAEAYTLEAVPDGSATVDTAAEILKIILKKDMNETN